MNRIMTELPPRGCIFEVDTVVLDGLQLLYKVVEDHAQTLEIKIDEGVFLRYCMGGSVESALGRLLHSFGRRSSPEMVKAVKDQYYDRLASQPTDGLQGLAKLVKELLAKNAAVGLITKLDEDAAKSLFAPVLAFEGVHLIVDQYPLHVGSVSWDSWKNAATAMGLVNHLLVAVVASAASCKSALAANLPVIAIPNEMTDYQDFSGAYHWCDSLDSDKILPAILQTLRLE